MGPVDVLVRPGTLSFRLAGLIGVDGRTEAYELATIMTRGIGTGAVTDRAAMRAFLASYTGDGPMRRYGWDATGELRSPELLIYEVG